MRKIKEILRLHLLGGVTSTRRIGLVVGCGKSAVAECLRRAIAADLTDWAAVEALDENALEQRLYPAKTTGRLPRQRPLHSFLPRASRKVRMHHPALNWPRTDNCYLDYKVVKTPWLESRKHRHLRPRFNLEHADAISLAEHVVDRRISFRRQRPVTRALPTVQGYMVEGRFGRGVDIE